MNIQEAKEEVIRTIRAYTAKDEHGRSRIPVLRQRPVLLIGPPGIGKTAIMEQAARECQVGLISYTITHHTRQSAVGLPQLVTRKFGDLECTMTEYTMSEIVGSVYEYEERTGYREGILFIDEINCVSETLAPTMLQFLQYKMFGNHKIPKGWVIVAAGNPKEYNQSVRELDMAAMDRVRTLTVEADYGVWKDYAVQQGVHPAVLSYLELHPEHFYQVTLTREKKEFVTARGWEDLSALLTEYERQGLSVSKSFMEEFLRVPKIAADFAAYYQFSQTCLGAYPVTKLLEGGLMKEETQTLQTQLSGAPKDARCIFLHHLLSKASGRMTAYGGAWRLFARKKEVLWQFFSYMFKEAGETSPDGFLKRRFHALQVRRENDLLKPWEETMEAEVDAWLGGLLTGPLVFLLPDLARQKEEVWREHLEEEVRPFKEQVQRQKEELLLFLDRMTDFLKGAFGEDLELTDWLQGIKKHGDAPLIGYVRPEMEPLLNRKEQEERLRKSIREMEVLYEAGDRK